MFDDIQSIDAYYEHFEQLRDDAMAWELDFRQLGRGENGHRLVQAVGANFHYVYTVFNSPYDQRSASPRHLRTFSVLAEERSPSSWCGHNFSSDSLMMFARGEEFRAVSQGYFSNHVFSLPEQLLEHIAESQFETSWTALGSGTETAVAILPAAAMNKLRQTLETLAKMITAAPERLVFDELVSLLAFQLVDALLTASNCQPSRAAVNRRRYFREAQDYIDAEIETPILMERVCDATGVSNRTLEYAFRECAGVTPKAYISRQRLARFHRALVERDKSTKIAELANRWGFWHMGQLARDYRSIYGVNPGVTLELRGVRIAPVPCPPG